MFDWGWRLLAGRDTLRPPDVTGDQAGLCRGENTSGLKVALTHSPGKLSKATNTELPQLTPIPDFHTLRPSSPRAAQAFAGLLLEPLRRGVSCSLSRFMKI